MDMCLNICLNMCLEMCLDMCRDMSGHASGHMSLKTIKMRLKLVDGGKIVTFKGNPFII